MDRASERGISTKEYLKAEDEIYNLYKSSAINETEILENLNLFTTVQHKKVYFFMKYIKKLLVCLVQLYNLELDGEEN